MYQSVWIKVANELYPATKELPVGTEIIPFFNRFGKSNCYNLVENKK